MKKVAVVIASIIILGIGIWLTIHFILNDKRPVAIPFIWIGVLAVWAESINIIVNDYKNKKKD